MRIRTTIEIAVNGGDDDLDDADLGALARKLVALFNHAKWDRQATIASLIDELSEISADIDFKVDEAMRSRRPRP